MADREFGEKLNLQFHQVMLGISSCGWYDRCMYVHDLHVLCHVDREIVLYQRYGRVVTLYRSQFVGNAQKQAMQKNKNI